MPLVFGTSCIKWFLPLILSISSFILVVTNNIFKGSFQEFLRNNIPDKIWLEFTNVGFSQLNATRLEILNSALRVIINNPFFGTGAASFPIIYEFETGFWKGHSHNLFAELSISYGLPSTIILIAFFGSILFTSFKNLYRKKETNIKDRAFFVAILIFLLSQLVDIQYFDGRISLVFWLLLASLKSINDENKLIRYE